MHNQNRDSIDLGRRQSLKTMGDLSLLGVLTSLGIMPNLALAGLSAAAFEAKSLDAALDALGGFIATENAAIQITAPEIAENGTVVPVTVECSLPQIEQISILVEKNPTILAASFLIPKRAAGYVNTKIKMAQTSKVIALVKANGKFYRASKEVKVSAGGC
ncbi:MAG: thiosulfate oxidation carrier protein SoxY [Gallionellaceae bacterium]|nr:thiosulfate oxidation carrier protein SoxY [Gallionellaceae bacterium]